MPCELIESLRQQNTDKAVDNRIVVCQYGGGTDLYDLDRLQLLEHFDRLRMRRPEIVKFTHRV